MAVNFNRALWEVRWVHNRRIVIVTFRDDFAEALRIYTKALAANRADVTLRCRNMGTAPPTRLRPFYKKPKKKGDEGERVEPLASYNLKGWLWCPYCIHLRKFVHRNGFTHEGHWVPEPQYECQMCGVTHRDQSVTKWNPIARRWRADGVRAIRKRKAHA